jgi:hypothetical protein
MTTKERKRGILNILLLLAIIQGVKTYQTLDWADATYFVVVTFFLINYALILKRYN